MAFLRSSQARRSPAEQCAIELLPGKLSWHTPCSMVVPCTSTPAILPQFQAFKNTSASFVPSA